MSTFEKLERIKMKLVEDNKGNFPELFSVPLPQELHKLYGGNLCFLYDPSGADIPLIHINFVMSKEGIFNLANTPGGGPISQGNMADPFVMALLRAHADAVMVGAETLRKEGDHVWNFQFIFDAFPHMRGLSDLLEQFTNFRESLGKEHRHPPTFFMTNSGNINPHAEVFKRDDIATYVVTGARGKEVAQKHLSGARNTEVLSFGEDTLDELAMLSYLKRKLGIHFLLHEGGRGVVDALVKKGLVAEFFLTHMNVSPKGDVSEKNAQYLFSTNDHLYPHHARVIEKRIDAKEEALFLNLDFRYVRSM